MQRVSGETTKLKKIIMIIEFNIKQSRSTKSSYKYSKIVTRQRKGIEVSECNNF